MSARAVSSQAGKRLDQVAAELFPDFSRARLQKWIRCGALTVDGRQLKTTYRIGGSEVLRLDAVAEHQHTVLAQDIPLDVIHSDEDIIVVNKSAGLVVHPAAGNPDGTLQNALLHFDGSLAALPRSGIVHRLDKDTTGVMVVARSLRAHTSLVGQLQARKMSRIYRAIAIGNLRSDGSVDAPIGRHPRNRKKMAVVPSGRPAISHYRILRRMPATTYLEVSLETGRTHQIRVHLAHLGHPLAGDAVYGRGTKGKKELSDLQFKALNAFPRQALHARTLELLHPGKSEKVRFQAPLPDDFAGLLEALEDER
jgi:23S rRNA pseudouridine1911/1915/1917 synthase